MSSEGFKNKNCEVNINECNPCESRKNINECNPCKNDGNCIDGINDYICNCKDGYTGKNCEVGS